MGRGVSQGLRQGCMQHIWRWLPFEFREYTLHGIYPAELSFSATTTEDGLRAHYMDLDIHIPLGPDGQTVVSVIYDRRAQTSFLVNLKAQPNRMPHPSTMSWSTAGHNVLLFCVR